MSPAPTLRRERELFRAGAHRVAGMDEVGRGAIAGPVSVGITVITETTRTAPVGLRDSKLLTPQARERLGPRVVRWATESAVGHATPSEIDDFGLTAALRLAALRALEQVGRPDVIILDGSHDWLTEPAPTLFDIVPWPACGVPQVSTVIRADRSCSSVAAASVIAKVTRDGLMTALHDRHGGYGWDVNKGYSTPEHGEAVRSLGLTEQHRRSWNLACCDDPDPDSSTDVLAEVHTVDLREVVPSAT